MLHKIKLYKFVVLVIAISIVVSCSNNKKDENPISQITKPKSTTTTSTLPVPQLPQPEDSPADPYEKVPVNKIGTIEIPKISLSTDLYEGVWLTVLNVGPGHWPGTAMPGQYGNAVIAGHRVTHSKPFRHIDDLIAGDEIIVTSSQGRFTYKVTGHQIVYPKDIWIVDQTPGYRITLFACHPPGSAAQRYVIYGELVNPPKS
ncbi:MAG: class E sortase [Acidimicrobiia bacterium]